MAYQPNPNDPYRAGLSDEEIRHQARLNSLDNELQADPSLAEGSPSGAKVAMFAVAIAVVLGALFYGLNNTTVNQAGTSPPTRPHRRSRLTLRRLRACVTSHPAATTSRARPRVLRPTVRRRRLRPARI